MPYRELQPDGFELESKQNGIVERFMVKGNQLVYSWSAATGEGSKTVELSELAARLDRQTGSGSAHPGSAEKGVLAIGLAVVVALSELQPLVPLLAPFLALAGIFYLAKSRGTKGSWTVINDRKGQPLAHIYHGGCKEVDRRRFEERLVERLETLR